MTTGALKTSEDITLPGVSLVLIGRNEGERLIRCLESVKTIDYPPEKLELIYVDSNSADDSCNAARAAGATVIEIRQGPFSAARARNLGWRRARYELVHFFDADTIINPQWVRKAVSQMGDPTIGSVSGRREETRPNASIYMRVCSFEWYAPPGPCAFSGGDALFRRDALARVEGFDESMIAGEEPELCHRIRGLGLSIWRLDESMTQHDMNMTTFRQYWKRAVRSGWAYAVVGARCRRGRDRVWQRENVVIVGELAFWAVVLTLSVATLKLWGLLVTALLLLARIVRIGATVRKRADSWSTSLLYGLHCLFSRFPLFIGQLRGLWFLLTRRPATLIEYNTGSTRTRPCPDGR